MNRRQTLLMICAFGLWAGSELSGAQRTFVSAAVGDDANACTRALPCRNFSAALAQTDPDGEVIVLDSGGYGVVTVTQSVSLISPRGVYAGITAFASGTAVKINAGDSAHVVLRNLSLNSQGAFLGVEASFSAAALYIEQCTISGFTFYGILFDGPGAGRLHVTDTAVRRSNAAGIFLGNGVLAMIDSVQLQDNGTGVYADGAVVNVRQSTAGPGVAGAVGFRAQNGARMVIHNSVATGNGHGFYADGASVMTITRSAANANTSAGVRAAGAGTTIYVSDSTITANANGVLMFTGGVVTSRDNNTLQTNTTNGVFSSNFLPN